MNLSNIKPGSSIVLIDKRGVRFHAHVIQRRPGELRIRPTRRNITWRTAAAREVVAHWRKSKQSRA
jgi:hypothetical protein